MNFTILIFGAILNLALGSIVLLRAKDTRIKIIFFLLTLSLVLWSVFNYYSVQYDDPRLSLYLMRTVMSFAVLQTFFFYLFSIVFPSGEFIVNKKFFSSYLILVFIALVIVFSPFMFSSVTINNATGARSPVVGPGMLVFVIAAVGSVILGFINLIKKFSKATGFVKDQIKFLFIGVSSMFFLMIFFNLFLVLVFKVSSFVYLGTAFVLPFVAFTTYAMVQKKLFDIKVILTETAAVIVILSLAIQTFLSKGVFQISVNFIMLLLVSYGGYLLIKSVKDEISRRIEIQKLAKRLEDANDHLKELDKTKDDFLSMASHELNTPIAAIEGYLSMILEEGLGGEIPPKTRQYLESVFNSSKRLAGLVKGLLNVSRIQSNRIHLVYQEIQIEDMIQQCVMELDSKVRESKHHLTFEKPTHKMPITWADTTRITEVLINILGNSIKYTPDGGKIHVKVVNDDKKLVISVEDNGKGIPKDKVDRVFEKFSQVDILKDEVKGTGLGMYIAKRFIELHHGKIWFHSDGVDKGTTFYFSLPILNKKPFDPHEGEGDVLH